MKETAWSLSRLQASETCLKKFAAEVIDKSVKPPPSFEADEGKRKHEALARYVEGKGQIPSELIKYKNRIDGLLEMGKPSAEVKLCIDRQMQPVAFFAKDAWCRGIIDLHVAASPVMSIVTDWKFGKPKEGTDQLDLMATLLFTVKPNIQKVVGLYFWFKEGFLSNPVVYTRKQLPELWEGYMARVKKYQAAISSRQFPPSPSGLCKAHCLVTGCPYYGKGPM